MPSIPQSLLWISLVVLWLFVLVPMLISKRDAVRRTSDVALATRVLNNSGNSRLRRRSGPAAGHYSDPHWRHESAGDDVDELDDELTRAEATTDSIPVAPPETDTQRAVVLADVVETVVTEESKYLDVEVIDEDSGALPVGASFAADNEPETAELPLEFDNISTPTAAIRTVSEADFAAEAVDQAGMDETVEAEPVAETADVDADQESLEDVDDGTEHDYEYVDDSSGVEAPESEAEPAASTAQLRRNRYESKASIAAAERKYRFRSRMLSGMGVAVLLSGIAAFTLSTSMWWLCAVISTVTLLYLAYLRRQTRIEEQLRRRRAQRMMRSRHGVESTHDEEFDVVPSRLRRPGAAVLDIDDEDPIFEHLEYATASAHYDLPRAAGQ
ncbi:putative membrane protein [Mycobacterium sp. MAA66]|uniref:divisome protein SepX/GlpR n=1 Tax=Mycobacterium sp. MAA66 TaxID=3156297 RepID=UPI00351456E3